MSVAQWIIVKYFFLIPIDEAVLDEVFIHQQLIRIRIQHPHLSQTSTPMIHLCLVFTSM